jgi:hypothetical protein
LPSLSKPNKYAREKPFSRAKLAYVDISLSNFNVRGHIPSTSADALTSQFGWSLGHVGVEMGFT